MEYGGCSRFWYGGCEGNDNRFKSQDDCKRTCVSPEGKGKKIFYDRFLFSFQLGFRFTQLFFASSFQRDALCLKLKVLAKDTIRNGITTATGNNAASLFTVVAWVITTISTRERNASKAAPTKLQVRVCFEMTVRPAPD